MIWIWAVTTTLFVALCVYLLRMQTKRVEEYRRATKPDQ